MGERSKSGWNPPRDYVLLSSSPCSTRQPYGIEGRSFSNCSAGVAETIKIARSSKEVNARSGKEANVDDDDDGKSTAFQDDFMHRSHQIDYMMETTSLHTMGFDRLCASFDWNLAVLQANGIDDSGATNSKL